MRACGGPALTGGPLLFSPSPRTLGWSLGNGGGVSCVLTGELSSLYIWGLAWRLSFVASSVEAVSSVALPGALGPPPPPQAARLTEATKKSGRCVRTATTSTFCHLWECRPGGSPAYRVSRHRGTSHQAHVKVGSDWDGLAVCRQSTASCTGKRFDRCFSKAESLPQSQDLCHERRWTAQGAACSILLDMALVKAA